MDVLFYKGFSINRGKETPADCMGENHIQRGRVRFWQGGLAVDVVVTPFGGPLQNF